MHIKKVGTTHYKNVFFFSVRGNVGFSRYLLNLPSLTMSWFFVASVLSLVCRSYAQTDLGRHNCSTVSIFSCSIWMLGATIFWLCISLVFALSIFSPVLRLSLFS